MFDDGNVVTIQQTGKKWKGLLLLAKLCGWFSVYLIFSPFLGGAPFDPHYVGVTAGLLIIAAIGLGVIGRFGAWWHHG
jgi:hypothetical protein